MLIYDLNLNELTEVLKAWNEPAYRAKQIWQVLYQHLYSSPDQFTNLPRALREKIAENFTFLPFQVSTYLDSSDGFTRKTLFQLPDGNLIEAVLMRYGDPADNPQITHDVGAEVHERRGGREGGDGAPAQDGLPWLGCCKKSNVVAK